MGEHSRKFRIQGEAGEDRIIYVPPGVQVSTADGKVIGERAISIDSWLAKILADVCAVIVRKWIPDSFCTDQHDIVLRTRHFLIIGIYCVFVRYFVL